MKIGAPIIEIGVYVAWSLALSPRLPNHRNQTGDGGQALTQPLEITVSDGGGNPVAGTLVRFAASSGGGAVVPIQAATDAQGKVRTTAYLGKDQIQTFTAFAGSASVRACWDWPFTRSMRRTAGFL